MAALMEYLDVVALCACADASLPTDRPHARLTRASDIELPNVIIPWTQSLCRFGSSPANQAIEAFWRRWGVTELDLFGSAIRDDFRADSDVDVLASFAHDRRPTLLTLVQMEAELAHLFGRKVDLPERRSVERSDNYIRGQHILAHRESLYVAGPA
jgi:uncharacterized protein